MRRDIPYVRIANQFQDDREEILRRVAAVLDSGMWVGGPEVDELEKELAKFCGVAEAVALSSGTDALMLALKLYGIGPGDEVITAPNSFIATAAAIAHMGARVVFADVGEDQNLDPAKVEAAVTPRTKAIMPVHLAGRVCDMDALGAIAKAHGLKIIEDAAQAAGCRYRGRHPGQFGGLACFSGHPLKSLNACGDAGFMTLDDAEMAARLRRLRNHGLLDRETSLEWGFVARLDPLKAAFLRLRLDRLPAAIEARRRNAEAYRQRLDARHVFVAPCRPHEFNGFHTFVIQVDRRDALQAFLKDRGVGTGIHYGRPLHLQPAAAALGYKPGDFPGCETQSRRILSLPVNQHMAEDEIAYVAEQVNAFFKG